jgi:hypothetical protein
MSQGLADVQAVRPAYVPVQPQRRPLVDRCYSDDRSEPTNPLAHNGISQMMFGCDGRVWRGVPLHRYPEIFSQLNSSKGYWEQNAAVSGIGSYWDPGMMPGSSVFQPYVPNGSWQRAPKWDR